MGKYSDNLIKELDRQIVANNQNKQRKREVRKASRMMPSPSSVLVPDMTADSVATNTINAPANTDISTLGGVNLSSRGFSSSRDGSYAPKNTDFVISQMGDDLKNYNKDTIGMSYKTGARPVYNKATKAQAEELKTKYGLTDSELEAANTKYTKNMIREAENRGVEQTEKFAQAHPILGEAERTILAPISSAEGYVNVAGAKMGRSAEDIDTVIARLRDAAASGLDNRIENSDSSKTVKALENGALGLARSGLDLGVNAATSALLGIPMGALTAGSAMDDYMQSAIERGSDAKKAANVAMGVGAIDALLQKKGLDEIANISKVGKNAASTFGRSSLVEGAEEGLQDLSTKGLDTIMNWDNSQFKTLYDEGIANGLTPQKSTLNALKIMAAEVGQNAAGGALFGGAMGLGNYALNGRIGNASRAKDNNQTTSVNADSNSETNINSEQTNAVNEIPNPEIANRRIAEAVNDANRTAGKGNEPAISESVLPAAKPSEEITNTNVKAEENIDANKAEKNIEISEEELVENRNLAENIVKATQGYEDFDADDIAERINLGEDVSDVIDVLNDIADPESMMPKEVAENARILSEQITSRNREMAERVDNSNRVVATLTETPTISTDPSNTNQTPNDTVRSHVSPEIDVKMRDAGIRDFGLKQSDDLQRFSDSLAAGKAANNFGYMVDGKSVDDLIQYGAKVFMDDNGSVGFCVEKDGNISGVFKNSKMNREYGAVDDIIITARENGGTKLDCFGKELVKKYERNGFIPVAVIKWDEKNAPADWKGEGLDVYIMMKDGRTTAEVLDDAKNHTVRYSSDEELNNLPVFDDYDEALKYRDDLLAGKNTEQNVNISENPQVNTEGNVKKGLSDVVYNTALNSDVVSRPELDSETIRGIAEYAKHNEADTFNKGMNRFLSDAEGEERAFVDGTNKIAEDSDVDTAMLILTDLSARAREARNNGMDEASVSELVTRRNDMLSVLRREGTRVAQMLQAFAKWNRTPEGAVINAERIMNERASRNKPAQRQATQISTKLLNALNAVDDDGTIRTDTSLTLDELKSQVRNTIDRELGSISNKFTDGDVDYLANLLYQGISKEDLTSALRTKLTTDAFRISDETIAAVNAKFEEADAYGINSKERVELEEEAYSLLADEIYKNANIFEKFEAWRYLSMLGNAKTHIRNILGNKTFGIATGISNNIAAGIEALYSRSARGTDMVRTKAFLNPANKADNALISGAREDARAASYRQLTGTKYSDAKHGIQANRNVFSSRLVRSLNAFNNRMLSNEDTSAMIKKYSTSLAGYLKANGITDADIYNVDSKIRNLERLQEIKGLTPAETSQLSNLLTKQKILNAGREYAVSQAEYAAFHEENEVANLLNQTSKKLREGETPFAKMAGYAIEGILPFKKTPANILRSGIDYSPVGLIKAFSNIRNKKDAHIVIDDFAKSLTGTGIMVAGYFLAEAGLININNDDQKYSNLTEGKQQYSLNINGHTFTIDFLAPSVMPLLVGAQLSNLQRTKSNFDSEAFYAAAKDMDKGELINQTVNALSPYINAMSNISSPIMETSMLSGLNDVVEELGQNGLEAGLGQLMTNTLTGYVSQGVPTILGQLARTIDNTRRSTYTDQKGVAGALDKKSNKVQNKIPFLSMRAEPYINSRGETERNAPTDNIALRAAYQFLSPTYIQNINTTAAERGSDSLYNQTVLKGEPDPKALINLNLKAELDNERLSKKEYTQWAIEQGKVREDLLATVYSTKEYQQMPLEDKLTVKDEIEKLSKQIAMNKVMGKEYTAKDFKLWVESGENPTEYIKKKYGSEEPTQELPTEESEKITDTNVKDTNTTVQQPSNNSSSVPEQPRDVAIELGFINTDGSVNSQSYKKVSEFYGDDTDSIRRYATMSNELRDKYDTTVHDTKFPNLVEHLSAGNYTDAQRGEMIIIGKGLKNLASSVQEEYKKNKDASVVWKYYRDKY